MTEQLNAFHHPLIRDRINALNLEGFTIHCYFNAGAPEDDPKRYAAAVIPNDYYAFRLRV